MALDERARHELHRKLEEVLGADQAGTLMELLPPVGWADVATKRDLDALGSSLRSELTLRLEALEHRLRAEISTSARTTLIAHIGTTIGAIIAVAGLR
jgi:hypothetical protein